MGRGVNENGGPTNTTNAEDRLAPGRPEAGEEVGALAAKCASRSDSIASAPLR